jgi:thioredoxin-like negative regulator of GroEL
LYDQVLKAVESIKDSYVKDRVSEATAQELATARQYNHALKVAQTLTATIKDNHDKERALEALVRELAASGRYNQALKVVETIKDDETKEKALQAIAGYRKSPR